MEPAKEAGCTHARDSGTIMRTSCAFFCRGKEGETGGVSC